MFDCTCNTQNSLLLNQHNGDDAPHDYLVSGRTNVSSGMFIKQAVRCGSPSLLVGGVDNFTSQRNIYSQNIVTHLKGKAAPLQAWTGPEVSRKLRVPDFMTTTQDVGKVVSLTHRPLFTPRKYSWYSFLLEAESTPGP